MGLVSIFTNNKMKKALLQKTQPASAYSEADLWGGCRGCVPPPPPEMTCGFLIQLVFSKKKRENFVVYWC